MNTELTAKPLSDVLLAFPCFHAFMSRREQIREELLHQKKPERVETIAAEHSLNPTDIQNEYEAMCNGIADFDTAYNQHFTGIFQTGKAIPKDMLYDFILKYSIRYCGSIPERILIKKFREKGRNISHGIFRRIDLQIWKNPEMIDFYLSVYLGNNQKEEQ